ncbi:ABC transporter ATP-binding protein [Qipengyuania nanhaisediminis]|uniref:ABC transporter ATP-binding protein n=1 Tax=Qipengyuania nanhaisediminis TaxID=604088 RepID=UPI0038B3A1F3
MSLKFWIEWALKFKRHLLLIAALTLLSSAATLALPWLAAQLLGGVLAGSSGQSVSLDLTQVLVALVVILVLMTLLNIAAAVLSESSSTRILTELRKRIYAHVQMMPIAFHDDARRGDILALTSYEVGNLSDFLAASLANAPAQIVTALGAVAVLFLIDPAMALIVPLLVPAFYVLAKVAGRRLREVSQKVRGAEAELIAITERDLAMLPAIKSFAVEAEHRKNFAAAAEKSRKLALGQARLNAFIGPVMALFAAVAAIGVLLVAHDQLSGEGRPVSELFAFLLYAALLTRPVAGLANIYGIYQMARGTLARLEGVLSLEPEPGYDEGDTIGRADGGIAFEQVEFGYPGRAPVFRDLNLEIAPGEIVALTGENGVGKSTLVRLLLRYYRPDRGTIRLDGRDIEALQIQSLRRQFGYVPQRALLFNGTVSANIAFGKADACPQAIAKAARLAQAEDFIASLPDGLDTEIGDNGVRLSGGQRQRIALARALFCDPPILILDEATSMFDLESEAAFVEDCVESLEGRTVMIITHRPASLALADRVLKVGPGGVREIASDAR